jgi:hypothetical protein
MAVLTEFGTSMRETGVMQNERDVEFTPSVGMDDAAGRAADRTDRDATGGALGQTAAKAGEAVHDVADRAREVAAEARHRAADEVEARVADGKRRAASSLEDVADSLRTASEQLDDGNGLGRYMVRAASQVDNLASFLNNREIADLVDEVEYFARRQPAVFVGGAFALGVLGARFLRSSRSNLIDEGVRDHWPTDRMTSRMRDPARDSVSRPDAPGYVSPPRREDSA